MIRSSLATLVFALCFAIAANTAQAQLRSIPADAKRATMSHVQGMTMSIDGKQIALAAGAQLRDAENRIVLPAAFPADARVKYQVGQDGKLTRAWILTPTEAAQPDPKK
ncbi:MAG: hypothetical protein ACREVG_11370 [Burkholderiales bacterium]